MKNRWLLLVLGIIVIIAGVYFLTMGNEDTNSDLPEDSAQEEPEEPEQPEEPEEPEVEEDTEFVEGEDIEVGKPAPSFKYRNNEDEEVLLTNLKGEEVKLEDYEGKIVLLNFWATWCKWCDVEMPDLDKLDKENDDLVVLAVNVNEDRETVEKYINEGGYEFETVLDLDGEIAKKYLISSYPTSYFLDKEGLLIGGVPGMMEYEQMVEVLNSVRDGLD